MVMRDDDALPHVVVPRLRIGGDATHRAMWEHD
jgi:hypothetical protein